MKKIKNIRGFSLLELLISIFLLIILSTIGFISYTSYLSTSRDSNRISQLDVLQKLLDIYRVSKKLPDPENAVRVMGSGAIIGYQGYLGKIGLSKLDFKKGGIDPLDDKYFTYYTTYNKKYFQIMGFMEEKKNRITFLNSKTYALDDNLDRFPTVYGYKLGLLTDLNNNPIQDLPNIISDGQLDISTTNTIYISYLTDLSTITGDKNKLNYMAKLNSVGGKGCNLSGTTVICE